MVTDIIKITDYFKQRKDMLLIPVVKVLHFHKITPNHLTNLRLILNLLFFYFFLNAPAALTIFLGMLLLDGLDGALARHTKKTSDRGAFLDLFVDLFCYAFFLFTFLIYGKVDVLIAGLHLLLFPATNLLAVLIYNEGKSSDWLIKPSPNLSYLKFPVIVLYVAFFLGYDYLNPVLYTLNILYVMLALYFYILLQKRWFPKS